MKFNMHGVSNLLTHWHRLVLWQQWTLLAFICLLMLYFPALNYWQQRSQADMITQQLQKQQDSLIHRQKILATLKDKVAKQLLTPELANKLPPINQQIQQLANGLQIEYSQWTFGQKPLLKLQLLGHFKNLQAFLTALLDTNNELELVEWQILKNTEPNDENSIYTELLFQLNIK